MSENIKTTSEYEGTDKVDIDELFTELVNNLCRLDMKYEFVSVEFDEFLKRLEKTNEAVSKQILSLKYQVHAYQMTVLAKKRVIPQGDFNISFSESINQTTTQTDTE